MDGAATDRSCETNPAAVTTSNPTVKCPYKYCTIRRQEYSDPAGQIYTFYRGCTDDGTSTVQEGGGFKVYIRVCTTDLCNNWDGISSNPSGGSGGGGGGGSGGSGGGGSGSGNSNSGNGILFVDGGAGNQRADLYVAITTFSVVMKLYW